MTWIDDRLKDEIATELRDHLEGTGYSREEIVGGLCEAICRVVGFDVDALEDCIDYMRELVDDFDIELEDDLECDDESGS